MQATIVIILAILSGVYLYFILFKKKGCGCGKSNCCVSKKSSKSGGENETRL